MMTLCIMAQSMMTLCMMTLCMMTLSTTIPSTTTLLVELLNKCVAECHNVTLYVKRCYAECHYAECRGAFIVGVKMS